MGEMKQIILHIGAGKTGTSALQVAFAQNVAKLREFGIVYPEDKYVERAKTGAITSGNALPLARFLRPDLDVDVDERQPVFDLLAHYDSEGVSSILYSSEKLSTFMPGRLVLFQKLCAALNFEIKVVFYVRSIVDHAFAMYVQRVRTSYSGSFSSYLESHWGFPFRNVIERLRGELGPNAILIKNYDQLKADLLGDFARTVLELDEAQVSALAQPGVVNRSYSREEVQVLAELNRFLTDSREAQKFSAHYLNLVPGASRQLGIWQEEIDIARRKGEEERRRFLSLTGEDLAYASESAQVFPGGETPVEPHIRNVLAAMMAYQRMRENLGAGKAS